METIDWIKIIAIVLGIIGIIVAFVIMPMMERKKIDVPVWMILLVILIGLIEFILGGRIIWITLH